MGVYIGVDVGQHATNAHIMRVWCANIVLVLETAWVQQMGAGLDLGCAWISVTGMAAVELGEMVCEKYPGIQPSPPFIRRSGKVLLGFLRARLLDAAGVNGSPP